jgi:hypothetical protein
MIGQGSWLRSSDLQFPKLALFQAELYPDELARCTGLEPVSLDRQSSCLTRCITAQAIAGRETEHSRAWTAKIWCAWLDSNEH